MGAQVASMTEAERASLDTVLDDSVEGEVFGQQAQMNAMAQLNPIDPIVDPMQQMNAVQVNSMPQMNDVQANMPVMPVMPVMPIIGGMPVPSLPNTVTAVPNEGLVTGPSVPGGGPVITIRTDMEAMMSDGIMPQGFSQGRQLRRNPFRGGGMGPMPLVPRYNPMDGGGGNGTMPSGGSQIRITKLE